MSRAQLHTRTIFLEANPLGADRLYVHGELRDVRYHDLPEFFGVEHPAGVVHHMGLDLEIDRDLVLRDVDAFMTTYPFAPSERTRGESCVQIVGNYRRLVGLKLDGAYAGRVLETVGGPQGCFHILSLAQCVPSAVRAASRRLCSGALEMPEGARDGVLDSCSLWREQSPLWEKAREVGGTGFTHFRRQIRVCAFADDDMHLGLDGRLADEPSGREPYGAELDVVLDLPWFHIVSAEARLVGAPLPGCAHALETVRQLESLSISKGFTASALEKIGGRAGCAHVSALVVALAPVTAQAAGALAGYLKIRPEDGLRGRKDNMHLDTCHMWRGGGPLLNLE